jgi:hypothetical protein
MPMQRARRLVSVAAVASLAVAGLSACRSAPSVAAYVGDTKITESRVDAVWNEARDAVQAASPPASGEALAISITRADVVRVLVSADVLPEVAKKHNVSLPSNLQLNEYASALHVPASTEFVRLFAQSEGYVSALQQSVKNAPAPTDDDLREVFDALLAAGQQAAQGTTFEQFKSGLAAQNVQAVQVAAAVRNEINEAATPLDVRVNPRYQPLGIPVLQFQTQQGAVKPLVVASLGKDETVPVTTIS